MRCFIATLFIAIGTFTAPAVADEVARCNKGTGDTAITACTHLIASGKFRGRTLAMVYGNRASAYYNRADYDRAIADYSEAIRLNPNYAIAYNNRGVAFTNKEEYDRAIADLNEAIRLDPRDADSYSNRGFAFNNKGEYDRAIADLNKAIDLDPRNAKAYKNRGYSYNKKREYDRAIPDFDQAIRLKPKFPNAYNHRGTAWRAKGDVNRAIADINEAIRLDATYTAAYANRGLAYEAKGDRERAQADFSTALAMPPNPKYENSKRAHETARARLKLLTSAGQAPAPPSGPQVSTSTTAPVAPPIFAPAADLGPRVALVIGNGAYANATALPNPPNDARSVAAALREIGFDVIEGTDLDHTGMERLVRDFLHKTPSARVSLLYYAGHGMQVDGRNYLVPVDAKLTLPSDLAFETLEVDKVLAGLDDETHANIIILDACRDNPLARNFASRLGAHRSAAVSTGLAAYATVGTGTLIAFATAPGQTALDGESANSPFTTALINHIRTPGIEVNQMLTRVRIEVASATRNRQVPWANSSLLGEVYLAGIAKP